MDIIMTISIFTTITNPEKRQYAYIEALFPDYAMMPISANIYNYDHFFRTKEMAKNEFHRFSQAYATAFDWSWGKTPEESFKIFWDSIKGRLKKLSLKEINHPKHIIERIQKMTSDEFGYNNWDDFKNL